MVNDEAFLQVIAQAPLVSIDLICRNPQGQVLLGKRLNRPARGCWFVPGGRIRKDERIAQAVARISRDETGQQLQASDGELLGAYEHLYPDNFFGVDKVSTHYVVLAYQFAVKCPLPKPDAQHAEFRWWSVSELLECDQVHANTKAYFMA